MRRDRPGIRTAFAAALLLAAPVLLALDPVRLITQYRRTIWQEDVGAYMDNLEDLAQTADGYIWMATSNGIIRFDGVRFTPYNLREQAGIPGRAAFRLLAPRDGSLWIGTSNGLLLLREGAFRIFASREGLPSDVVTALAADGPALWIGTSQGVCRLEGGRVVRTIARADGLPSNDVRAVAVAAGGDLWVGTSQGAALIRHGSIVALGEESGLPNDYVRDILADSRGRIWVTSTSGVFRSGDGARFERLPLKALVRDLFEDRDGSVWMAGMGGLSRMDGAGRLEWLRENDEESGGPAYAVMEDHEGGLWVSRTRGLMRLEAGPVTFYRITEGLRDEVVWSVTQSSDGTVWAGTNRGLSMLRPGDGFRDVPGGPGGAAILTTLADRRGGLWIGTYGGLWLLRNGRFTRPGLREGTGRDLVLALYESRDGDVWAACRNRAFRFRDDRPVRSYGPEDGLSDSILRAIAQDRLGRVWFGTNGDGVYRFSESGVAHFTTADGLFSNVVMALAADEGGSVWVGTEASGLNRIRDDQVDGFGPETGLPDQPVYSILPGGPDHIWVSSARSVARIPKAQLDAIAAKWRERIDPPVSVSIGGGEVSAGTQPAAWKGADGTLWLPTNRGLLNVAPDMIRAETAPPAAKLEEVMIDGRVPAPAATLRVKPGRHHYTFRFTAFDYHEPALVRFRYRLEGFDPDWIDARRERIAHYTNLPPGTYDFRAAAAAPTGPWSGREIRQRVVVEPAFWQTAGFRVAAALAVAGLVLAAFQLRHRSLVRRRDELERLVARRTDQLRKQGEEREAVLRSLRESEQRVSLAAAAGRVAMWEWQPEAGILVMADAWREILGHEPSDRADAAWWLERVHPEDREAHGRALETVLQGPGRSYEGEFRFRHARRGWVWYYVAGRSLEAGSGGRPETPLRIIGLHQDISERKRTEASIREHAEELERFNKAMVDREMRIIEMKEEVNRLCARAGLPPAYPEIWKEGSPR